MLMFHCRHVTQALVLQKKIGTSVKKPKDPQTDFPTAFSFLMSYRESQFLEGLLIGLRNASSPKSDAGALQGAPMETAKARNVTRACLRLPQP